MTDPVFALEPDIPRNVRIARWLLFRLLSGIREGSLTVREGAQTFHFGDPAATLHADAQVLSAGVYWRLLTGGSLAAAEAWMDGEWESQQLTQLLQILARNGKGTGAAGARLPATGQARRTTAPLDAPQLARAGEGEYRRPLRSGQRLLRPLS